ncbi:MAG TPA: hypothetical protein VGF16_19820 [Bryobacteraceae bacterium]|jgi:hypothetical protein
MTKPVSRLGLPSRKSTSDNWYRVDAAAEFEVKRGRRTVEQGQGEIVKLCQHSLVFQAQTPIPSGMDIEFDVPWPGCDQALVLRLTGRTVRNKGSQVTVRLAGYAFQTSGRVPRKPPKRSA